MSNLEIILQFVKENQGMTVFLIVAILAALCYCVNYAIRIITILFRGYPPPHCDVYGDSNSEIEIE